MCDDEPGDLVHDVFASALLGDSALGRPILGTTGSIEGMARDTVAEYYHSWYTPPRLVVAIAGNIDHDRALGLVAEAFAGRLTAGPGPVAVRAGRPDAPAGTGVAVLRRPIEQANVVLGTTCMSRLDDRRYALGLLSSVLGGGMSSRLLQEIREKRGLAYSVYTFVSHYADTGLFGVYAGCAPRRVDEVLALCREQLADVAAAGVTAEELERAKGQSRGSLVLNLEDTGSRMSRIGKGELMYGELQSVDEVLARVNAVTLDDVRAVAADLLSGPMALGVIGPFDDHDFSAALG